MRGEKKRKGKDRTGIEKESREGRRRKEEESKPTKLKTKTNGALEDYM